MPARPASSPAGVFVVVTRAGLLDGREDRDMQDTHDQAGDSPARTDRLPELEQWANDLPRRLAGGSDRGITRWAVAEIEGLRAAARSRRNHHVKRHPNCSYVPPQVER
jgi:hypothetical protein